MSINLSAYINHQAYTDKLRELRVKRLQIIPKEKGSTELRSGPPHVPGIVCNTCPLHYPASCILTVSNDYLCIWTTSELASTSDTNLQNLFFFAQILSINHVFICLLNSQELSTIFVSEITQCPAFPDRSVGFTYLVKSYSPYICFYDLHDPLKKNSFVLLKLVFLCNSLSHDTIMPLSQPAHYEWKTFTRHYYVKTTQ